MMRRLPLILLLLAAVLPGCRRDPLPEDGPQAKPEEMGIYISCPGVPRTRGNQGDSPAREEEYKVHTLQVWVFTSEDHELLHYLSLAGEDQLPAPGQTRRYAIPVESEFARRNPLPRIDVFALANAASVGCSLDENSDWDTVNDTDFTSDSYFGLGEERTTSVNPETGLPMTGVRRNMSVTPSEDGIVLNAEKIVDVVRIVSKIRYVFCRLKDDEDPQGEKVSIQNITLNGDQIPISEYLFTTTEPYRIGNQYDSRSVVTPGPSPIAPNENPEKLVFAGQNAAAYEQLLDDAVADGKLTEGGVMYFRESDKALTGTITFTTDGEQRTRVFSMAAPGDFARNHSWTLYGYFITGRKLELSINAIPWDYTHYHIDFSEGSVIASKMELDASTATIIYNQADDCNDVFFHLNTPAKGVFNITAPLHGKVMINAVGDANAFVVDPAVRDINPDVNGGNIEVTVRPNPDFPANPNEEYAITLSFYVETADGREWDANSEINRENYRFIR